MSKPTNTETNSEEAIPLGWTRVVRRRKRDVGEHIGEQGRNENNNSNSNNIDDEICCVDEICIRMQHSSKRPRSETSSSRPVPSSPPTMTEGQVVFCLQDTDPSWLQGYFFPKTTSLSSTSSPGSMEMMMPSSSAYIKPWGLLATQQELDDCLACADGGFRQITLKIYKPGVGGRGRGATDEGSGSKGPKQISDIDWTGGDMMRLSHEDGFVTMETDRLLVGNSALPYLSKYFAKLIQQLRKTCDVDVDTPILEWMPDVAILVGSMSISSLALAYTESTPIQRAKGDDDF